MASNLLGFGFISFLFYSFALGATPATQSLNIISKESIVGVLRNLKSASLHERVDVLTRFFLDRPFEIDPLGEGDGAQFDRAPLYRFDAFDCSTFVETILSLALSETFQDFEKRILQIRYRNGVVSFETRNHFPDRDWIANNIRAGFLVDITQDIAGSERIRIARTTIDRSKWYSKLEERRVRGHKNPLQKLAELRGLGSRSTQELAEVPYLPLDVLFKNRKPKNVSSSTLKKIPSGSIVHIVRPDWDYWLEETGTRLNISHRAFVVKKKGQLWLRHMSVHDKKSLEIPLVEYLASRLHDSSIQGINILKPVLKTSVRR